MKKLKERMDAFSDAVIAIIITIMVLELPLPQHDALSEYLQFGKSIGIFFISFCFVANIWYQHAMLFKDSDTMNDRVFGSVKNLV
ncbi:TMEM175 family protein [Pediococcus acidilactici]|nr:TMEM175 family protein [Pediococcus acidilactici]MCQ9162408.1 TMEM175 family protein [Pediococcus acidilactici]